MVHWPSETADRAQSLPDFSSFLKMTSITDRKARRNMKRLKFSYLLCIILLIFVLAGCGQGPEAAGIGGIAPVSSAFADSQAPSSGQGPEVSPGKARDLPEDGLLIHFIDVGQGDSILIQQKDHSMLVDAGENDQGEVVVSYLKEQGVTRLDYVIGTHPHSDHIGGLDNVIRAFEVGRVFLPPAEHTTATFEDVLDAVEARGLSLTMPQVGDVWELGEASFTILSPNDDYGDDLNNWSIGIRVEYGENHAVLCGDAEALAEEDICENVPELQADILKAGHHGSSTSSSDLFLDRVNPTWAVIQCGKDNSYGHPHQETLEKFQKRGIGVFRTDLEGTIVAASDGESITWYTGKGSEMAAQDVSPEASGADKSEADDFYILNTNTKKFHLPDCSSVSRIREDNRQEYTGSRQELIEEGYSPCGQCNP